MSRSSSVQMYLFQTICQLCHLFDFCSDSQNRLFPGGAIDQKDTAHKDIWVLIRDYYWLCPTTILAKGNAKVVCGCTSSICHLCLLSSHFCWDCLSHLFPGPTDHKNTSLNLRSNTNMMISKRRETKNIIYTFSFHANSIFGIVGERWYFKNITQKKLESFCSSLTATMYKQWYTGQHLYERKPAQNCFKQKKPILILQKSIAIKTANPNLEIC